MGESGSYNIGLTQTFNSRLQPNTFSATANGNSVMSLTYNFNPGTDNGNVMGITNNHDSSHGRDQTFTYDSLNRIATGQTGATTGSMCWGKTFNIDGYGNLYSTTAMSGYSNCSQTQLSQSPPTNNKFYAPCNPGTFCYDAEGRQLSAAGVNYSYDGDGNRVKKDNGTLYWYGAGADVLSETDLNGNNPVDYVYFGGLKLARVPSSGGPYYYLQDHLGTSRVMVAAGASSACYESDFEAYGIEHLAITATCAQNYKFAGMERDAEAQMEPIDHTPARQYPPISAAGCRPTQWKLLPIASATHSSSIDTRMRETVPFVSRIPWAKTFICRVMSLKPSRICATLPATPAPGLMWTRRRAW